MNRFFYDNHKAITHHADTSHSLVRQLADIIDNKQTKINKWEFQWLPQSGSFIHCFQVELELGMLVRFLFIISPSIYKLN